MEKISKKEQKKINIFLILDITASMGKQIEGVKKMINKYCENHFNPKNSKIHIMTYTESSAGCFICHFTSEEKNELINYVKEIKLSRPPDFPKISASGGDGPENSLAALAKIHKYIDPLNPILAFIITDAEPHYGFTNSSTAKKEREVLDELNYDTLENKYDVFYILDQILAKHNGKIMVIPILYSNCKPHFYYQVALLTGGVVIKPKNNDSENLAKGLSSIVYGVVTSIVGNRAAEITSEMFSNVDSFFFFDVSQFELFDKEPESGIIGNLEENKKDTKVALIGLFNTVLKIEGRKFRKRIKNVNFYTIKNSARLIVLLAKSFTKQEKLTNNEMATITQLLEDINEDLAPADALNFKAHMEDLIPKLLSNSPKKKIQESKTGTKSIITLETIRESVEILPNSEDIEENAKKWLPSIMKLIHIRLINVNFPLDSLGNPDFMDSWSASIKNYGPSIMSAHDAMIIRSEDGLYRDPLNGETYNCGLPFVQNGDCFGAFMFEIFSDLNILDLVTTYLLSGEAEVFRNCWSGLAASLMFNLLKKEGLKEIDEEMIDFLGYSIRLHYRPLASGVVKNLKNCKHLNPSDAIPKLVGGVLWFLERNKDLEEKRVLEILNDLLEEWTCGVNYKFMKHEKNSNFNPILPKDFICLDPDTVKDNDLITNLHPLEDNGDKTKVLKKNWENLLKEKFNHPLTKRLKKSWNLFLKKFNLESYSEKINFDHIFIQSFFYFKRKNRYNLLEDKLTHEKKEILPKTEEILKNWIKVQLKKQITALNKRRLSLIRNKLIENVKKIKGTQQECNEALKKNIMTLFGGKKYNLGRMDIIDILPDLNKNELNTLAYSLIFGNWTSQPAGQLYKHKSYLIDYFKAHSEIIQKIELKLKKRLLCQREEINRHGFSSSFQKIDPMEFTEEYGAHLIKNKPCRKNYVDQMRKYKEFGSGIIKKYEDKFYCNLINSIIYIIEDSNQIESGRNIIDTLVLYFENSDVSQDKKEYVLEILLKYPSIQKIKIKFEKIQKKNK